MNIAKIIKNPSWHRITHHATHPTACRPSMANAVWRAQALWLRSMTPAESCYGEASRYWPIVATWKFVAPNRQYLTKSCHLQQRASWTLWSVTKTWASDMIFWHQPSCLHTGFFTDPPWHSKTGDIEISSAQDLTPSPSIYWLIYTPQMACHRIFGSQAWWLHP